jgi:hypothetical protein
MTKLKHPIREAERYFENAKADLVKAKKDGKYYTDGKYVKAAGNAAWSGVLVALDAVLPVRQKLKKGQRPDFQDYQYEISKKDSKMTRPLLAAYESLHKTMGYDGNPLFSIVQDALNEGKLIVAWAEKHYQPQKAS